MINCNDQELKTANSMLEKGDYIAARGIYDRLRARDPSSFAAHYGLGMSFCAEAMVKTELGMAEPQDWYQAIYHMKVALHLQTNEKVRHTLAVLHFNLGVYYKKIEKRDEALLRIQEAVFYDSTLIKAYNLLGALYQEQGDFDRAEQSYRRALILKPDYAMAHFNLGTLSWARKEYAAAEKYFRDAVAVEPENGYFKSWLSKSLALAGKK